MAIFKVSRHDNPLIKKLVKAETITALIDAAKVKLSLTENAYKIFLEDFTEIDDDDILQELAMSSNKQLLLTLVPDGTEWNKDISAKDTSTVSKEMPESISQPCQSSSLRSTSHLDNIYFKLPTSVQKSLSSGKFLDYNEKKSLVHVVQNYMVNDIKNITRGTAVNIGNQIVNTYPESFTIKNLTATAAGASLGQKIYDRINYVKQDPNACRALQSCSLQELEEPTRKPKSQDEYGCIAYLPDLPETETWEMQEEKRLELIEEYKSSKSVDEVYQLMSKTYYLQRKHINKEKRNLSEFFIDWPYFCHFKIIIAHANDLLGIDCLKIWENSLEDLYVPINCFSRNKEILAIEKFKKKNKGKVIPEDMKYIHQELRKVKEYCNALKNKVPYKNILFDFLSKYMGTKEKLEFLYMIIKEDTSDEKLLGLLKVLNPVLIIRGTDIHDCSSKYDVVIEKKIIIHVNSFLDGILITFLSYFIFGFVYPSEIEGTLEIIQRLFLKINPPQGTKRGGKRKAVVQHPKYTTFIEEIDRFKNDDISDL